jgi:energy-coupling factor transporter ATP-binding protein EcfA2
VNGAAVRVLAETAEQSGEDLMYKLTGVSKIYQKGRRTIPAVRDLDLVIPGGEWLAVQGRTGHGKTTLLQLLGGLDRPTSGSVEFDGQDLAKLAETQVTRVRADSFGFIFNRAAGEAVARPRADPGAGHPRQLTGPPRAARRRYEQGPPHDHAGPARLSVSLHWRAAIRESGRARPRAGSVAVSPAGDRADHVDARCGLPGPRISILLADATGRIAW